MSGGDERVGYARGLGAAAHRSVAAVARIRREFTVADGGGAARRGGRSAAAVARIDARARVGRRALLRGFAAPRCLSVVVLAAVVRTGGVGAAGDRRRPRPRLGCRQWTGAAGAG